MHLRISPEGKARPDCFVVIDDFGTEHNTLDACLSSIDRDPSQSQRFAFCFSEDHDPDVTRARATRPTTA